MELSALERMTRLLEVTAALSKTMTPDQVADVVMHMGLSVLGARSGALLTMDDERGEYVLLESDTGRTAGRAGANGPSSGASRGTTRSRRLAMDADEPIVACARSGAPSATRDRVCWPLL